MSCSRTLCKVFFNPRGCTSCFSLWPRPEQKGESTETLYRQSKFLRGPRLWITCMNPTWLRRPEKSSLPALHAISDFCHFPKELFHFVYVKHSKYHWDWTQLVFGSIQQFFMEAPFGLGVMVMRSGKEKDTQR